MLKILVPNNAEFVKYEAEIKSLYLKVRSQIKDTNTFEFIRDNTFFYLFLNDKKIIGCIYYFLDEGKLFLNAFSFRKTYLENLECLKLSTTWFNTDIYAEAQNRASALCLLRCGFKRVAGNLFVYKKQLEK